MVSKKWFSHQKSLTNYKLDTGIIADHNRPLRRFSRSNVNPSIDLVHMITNKLSSHPNLLGLIIKEVQNITRTHKLGAGKVTQVMNKVMCN